MKTLTEQENGAQTQFDNRLAKARPMKLGWTAKEIERITTAMNTLIANYSVHFQKLKNYHWNVRGSDFFDLHEQFEKQYNEAQINIDEIAERIRVFGSSPMSTLQEYLELSTIKETGSNLNSDSMVREILSDYTLLLESMHEVIEVATSMHDAGTEELIKGLVHTIERHHWMLSAFMAK